MVGKQKSRAGKRWEEGAYTHPNPQEAHQAPAIVRPRALLPQVIVQACLVKNTKRISRSWEHVVYIVLLQQNSPKEIRDCFIQGLPGPSAPSGLQGQRKAAGDPGLPGHFGPSNAASVSPVREQADKPWEHNAPSPAWH